MIIWIKKVFFSFWFWLFGWRIVGEKPLHLGVELRR